MPTTTIEILQNEKVKLVPFEGKKDFDYLYDLIPTYKYNKINRENARKSINQYGHLFWTVYAKGIKVGVAYTSYLPEINWYHLDGYRDDKAAKQIDNKTSFGYEAGKLVSDYMLNNVTDKLWTIHDIKNRGATIMCKRMGFTVEGEQDTQFGKFIVLKKEK